VQHFPWVENLIVAAGWLVARFRRFSNAALSKFQKNSARGRRGLDLSEIVTRVATLLAVFSAETKQRRSIAATIAGKAGQCRCGERRQAGLIPFF